MNAKLLIVSALVLILSATPVFSEVSLTVYQRDIVLIRDTRTIDLKQGTNTIVFDGIAPGIYEATLRVTPAKTSGLKIIEQSYEYDLADQDRIWNKYVGEEFSFTKDDSLYSGKLLKFDDDFIYLELQDKPGSVALIEKSGLEDMTFDALPEGLVLHPEVHWVVMSNGGHSNLRVEISYLSDGITWQADYTALLENDKKVNLQGNLTLYNALEAVFEDASVDLIAGDLHRSFDRRQLSGEDVFGEVSAADEGETRFFEYRRYKVPQSITLHANQTKGLPLIGPVDVKAERDFFFDGSAGTGEVMIRLLMDNDKKSGLGMGLPEGDLLLYKKDNDGRIQFLGEDHLEASSPGDEIELLIGKAFDIRVDRRRISHQRIARNRTRDTFEIKFTSSRQEDSKITVRERLYGFWEVTEAHWNDQPVDYRIEHANMIEFDLNLESGKSAILHYVVEYGY